MGWLLTGVPYISGLSTTKKGFDLTYEHFFLSLSNISVRPLIMLFKKMISENGSPNNQFPNRIF